MSSETHKKEKRSQNVNREHSLYLVNVIILSIITLASLAIAGFLFIRERKTSEELTQAENRLSALEGSDKTLYTADQVSEKVEQAQATGRRQERSSILMQIQSSLESGNSVTSMLRDLFSDDLVVVSDGKYYFYPVVSSIEKNGFSDGDFAFDDAGRLTYQGDDTSVVIRSGMDVSASTGEIDWDAAASDGIEFVMICAGTRNDDGELVTDSSFTDNMDGALEAGLDVGVYWNLGATDAEEAKEEEEYLETLLLSYKDQITLPVAVTVRKVSEGSRIYSLSKAEWTKNLETFASALQSSGYTPMIYGSLASLVMKTDLSSIDSYARWIQEFSDNLYFPYSFSMWQYASAGSVEGVENTVHLDILVDRNN